MEIRWLNINETKSCLEVKEDVKKSRMISQRHQNELRPSTTRKHAAGEEAGRFKPEVRVLGDVLSRQLRPRAFVGIVLLFVGMDPLPELISTTPTLEFVDVLKGLEGNTAALIDHLPDLRMSEKSRKGLRYRMRLWELIRNKDMRNMRDRMLSEIYFLDLKQKG